MESTNQQPESRLHEYLKRVRESLLWMIAPMAATMLAEPLHHQFQIPQTLTCTVGYGVWVVQFFLYCRHVWQQTDKEKKELQKRFAAEDAALFGAARNGK